MGSYSHGEALTGTAREAAEAEIERARRRVRQTAPRWYAADTVDGSAHCGVFKNSKVYALCGEVFEPLYHPLDATEVLSWSRPVDETHGCRRCVAAVNGDDMPPEPDIR